jgi:hypothetical protein
MTLPAIVAAVDELTPITCGPGSARRNRKSGMRRMSGKVMRLRCPGSAAPSIFTPGQRRGRGDGYGSWGSSGYSDLVANPAA